MAAHVRGIVQGGQELHVTSRARLDPVDPPGNPVSAQFSSLQGLLAGLVNCGL